jgi:hypothetical protein
MLSILPYKVSGSLDYFLVAASSFFGVVSGFTSSFLVVFLSSSVVSA